MSSAESPNVLLVMCDQLSALATSPYGNADVLTPRLQQLADQGVVFANTYCNSPLCAPSRASMMTGRLPGRIPVNDNSEELPASIPTFAHRLRQAGYRTVLAGKMHFVGPDQLHGFEERLTTDIYPSDFMWTQHWPLLGDPPRDPDATTGGRSSADMLLEAGPVTSSAQLDYDEEVHFRGLERLRRLARRRGEERRQPWLLCVSYTQPHDPYASAQRDWDRYEGRELALPDGPERLEVWDRWVNAYHGIDAVDLSREHVYRVRRAYYAMTSYIDDRLGELLDELELLGFSRDTVVIFTSDHGDMVGENGMFFKRTFREWSTRVPLVVAGPGVARGRVVKQGVSLLDLYPTLTDLARLQPLPFEAGALDGHSLTPFLAGDNPASWPGPVVIEQNGEGVIRPTRTLVADRLKYVYTHGAPELLYDLTADPREHASLAADPAYADDVERLRTLCLHGWDPDEEERRILESQQRRLFLWDALNRGVHAPWDFQPVFDASRMHVRRPASAPPSASSPDQWDPAMGGG